MKFRSKRGRPRQTSPVITMTKELAAKRMQNLTTDPLDILQQRGIINESHYDTAMRLRWLHTLFFGAAGISAMDLQNDSHSLKRENSEHWLQAREAECRIAMQCLQQKPFASIVKNLCIYAAALDSEMLITQIQKSGTYSRPSPSSPFSQGINLLTQGLDAIHKAWDTQPKQSSRHA